MINSVNFPFGQINAKSVYLQTLNLPFPPYNNSVLWILFSNQKGSTWRTSMESFIAKVVFGSELHVS